MEGNRREGKGTFITDKIHEKTQSAPPESGDLITSNVLHFWPQSSSPSSVLSKKQSQFHEIECWWYIHKTETCAQAHNRLGSNSHCRPRRYMMALSSFYR